MHRLRIDEGATHDEMPPGRSRKKAVKGRRFLRRHVVERDEVQEPVCEPRHRAELRFAHSSCTRDDGLEDRLNVCRRTRNHAQDLACRGLPRQRLVALGRALFELAF